MRPIDADALVSDIESARNMFFHSPYERRFHEDRIEFALNMVEDVPTLDCAPVVHGYWKHEEPVKDDGQKPFVCSTCGLRHPRYGDVDKAYFSHCPWCGTQMDAKMDGWREEG